MRLKFGVRSRIAFVFLLTLMAVSTTVAARLKLMSIEVREGHVRRKPSFLGRVIGKLPYTERVEILETKGAWSRIRSTEKNITGWIHTTALFRKRIVLKAGTKDAAVTASSNEIALAGKGFNHQVEADYRKKNKNISFTWIDRMETFVVSPDEMTAFMKQGELQPLDGGGQ